MTTSMPWSLPERSPGRGRDFKVKQGPTPGTWAALFVVPCFTALAVALHLGSLVHLAYTPLCVGCAVFLVRVSPVNYVRYTIWIWCLSPLVRRLADYQAGYQQHSVILLAPFCVTLVCLLPLASQVGQLFNRDTLPFTLALLGVVYGVAIGLLRIPIATVAQTTLQWVVPLFFGLYCYSSEDADGAMAKTLKQTMVLLAFILSVYGIFQFFAPTAWDKFWLTSVSADLITNSFGSPEPMKIRVFSTLNSAGVLAPFLGCALLMLYRESKWVVAAVGLLTAICISLTMGRTEWLGVAVGGVYLLAKSDAGIRVRVVLGLVAAAFLLPLLPGASEPLQMLASRFGTFSDMGHDESAGMRKAGLRDAVEMVASSPFGQGMGYLDSSLFDHSQIAARDQVAAHDIGMLELGIELGYIGTLLYGAALVLVIRTLYRASKNADAATMSLIAACLTFACFVAITNPVIQLNGVLLWSSVGLILGRNRAGGVQAREAQMRAAQLQGAQNLLPEVEQGELVPWGA